MNQNKKNSLLEYIADSLNAENSTKYQQYLQHFETIRSTLLMNNQHQIHFTRVELTGSMKKRTAVHHKFDCDILVYYKSSATRLQEQVNGKTQCINIIQRILERRFYGINRMKTTPNSFQFSIGEFDFDILPAVDLVDDWNDRNAAYHQWSRTLQFCHSQPDPAMASYTLKASLSEYCDNFVRDKSPFIRRLIILCKHWCRAYLANNVNFSGRSAAMELIAVYVGLRKESNDLSNAFLHFLRICSNIQRCDIEFTPRDIQSLFNLQKVKRVRPFLLDPMNLYNNRLYRVKNLYSLQMIANQSLTNFHQPSYGRDDTDFGVFFRLSQYLTKEGATYQHYLNFREQSDRVAEILESSLNRLSIGRQEFDSEALDIEGRTQLRASIKSALGNTRPTTSVQRYLTSVFGTELRAQSQMTSHDSLQTGQLEKERKLMIRSKAAIKRLKVIKENLLKHYNETTGDLSFSVNNSIENLIGSIQNIGSALKNFKFNASAYARHLEELKQYINDLEEITTTLVNGRKEMFEAIKLIKESEDWPLQGVSLDLHEILFSSFLLLDSIRNVLSTRMKRIALTIDNEIIAFSNRFSQLVCDGSTFSSLVDSFQTISQIFGKYLLTISKKLSYTVVTSTDGIEKRSTNTLEVLLQECEVPIKSLNGLFKLFSHFIEQIPIG